MDAISACREALPLGLSNVESGFALHMSSKGWMGRQAAILFYVLALIGVVVGVDVLSFRNQFSARLIVNVGIVLVFAAFYLRFLKA